jgi:hypothetical protein
MGVVELEAVLLSEGAEILAMQALPFANHVLDAGAGQEILLA